MPSSWFPKPVYKQIRWFSLLFILLCAILGVNSTLFWYVGLAFIIVWLVLLIFASITIRSGFFIRTINFVENSSNAVFLSFDDGPVEETAKILDLLKTHKAKASFFCVGKQGKLFPEIVNRMRDEGHSIGNHSFNHGFRFPLLGVAKIKSEIQKTQDAIHEISGQEVIFFRPPFGVTNPLIAKALQGVRVIAIGWSVRSFDTSTKNKQAVINRIRKQIKPGSIILMHDTVPYIIDLLEDVLILCKEKNLIPLPLHEEIKINEND